MKIKVLSCLKETSWYYNKVDQEFEVTYDCHSNTGIMVMHFMPCCNPKVVSNPKLDSNGCLILKKI